MVEENKIAINLQRKSLIIKWLCGLIILASGIAIGAGATILMVKHRVIWVSKPRKDASVIAKQMVDKYSLTPQQTQQVQQIIDKAFEQRKLNDELQDKKREETAQAVIAEMNSVLTPQQYEKWLKDFQEMRDRYKKRAKK